jgi:hypothetical protein
MIAQLWTGIERWNWYGYNYMFIKILISEYIYKNFLAWVWTKEQRKTSGDTIFYRQTDGHR